MIKKLSFTIALIFIIVIIALRFLGNQPKESIMPLVTPAAQSASEAIASQISKKYNKAIEDVQITTDVDTGLFANGSIRFKDEFGGAIWFGAKTDKGWELVSDGQGPMDCGVADKYQMPKDLVPECVDLQGDSELIQR